MELREHQARRPVTADQSARGHNNQIRALTCKDQFKKSSPRRNLIPLWLTGARLLRKRHQGLECLICSDFRRIELSFQSTFHLSLTVLVRYRTREDNELQTKFTAQLALPSQATRLTECRHYASHHTRNERDCHPVFCSFQDTYARRPASQASSQRSGMRAPSCSFAITGDILFSFISLHSLICLNLVGNRI